VSAPVSSEFRTFVDVYEVREEHDTDRHLCTFLGEDGSEDFYTFGRVCEEARGLAARLQAVLDVGERALLLYPPGGDYGVALSACLLAGVIAVPAYPPDLRRMSHSVHRLRALIADADARAVLTTPDLHEAVEGFIHGECKSSARVIALGRTDAAATASSWRRPAVAPESIALLQYTSGSTAAPKGVMLSHRNLLANSAAIQSAFGHTPETRGVTWLPPYHDMGLIGCILQGMFVGLSGIIMSPVTFLRRPMRWLEAISRFQANTSGGPNFAYELCIRRSTPEQRAQLDLSSWDVAFNGAEPIRTSTLEAFAEAFAPAGFRREAFLPCYGLAESALIVSGGPKLSGATSATVERHLLGQGIVSRVPSGDPAAKELVSCGPAVEGAEVVIADPEELSVCPDGEVGEILVAGDSVGRGYWGMRDQTRAVFDARPGGSERGFMRTGDLGFLLDGELFVTGRLKELVIIRGRNFDPLDIEMACEEAAHELRRGCGAAFGVGDSLAIVYELSPVRGRTPEEVIRAIRQAVAQRLDVQVAGVALVGNRAVPKTSSGKIQRTECRRLYLEGGLRTIAEWSLGAPGMPYEDMPVAAVAAPGVPAKTAGSFASG
jgi:acyl-CoA synthetase (AMP-forming)/AMP-acid ligase II